MKSKIRILLLFFGLITAHSYAQEVANGGLFIGTLLTLIYVPMYAYIFDKKKVKSIKEIIE